MLQETWRFFFLSQKRIRLNWNLDLDSETISRHDSLFFVRGMVAWESRATGQFRAKSAHWQNVEEEAVSDGENCHHSLFHIVMFVSNVRGTL